MMTIPALDLQHIRVLVADGNDYFQSIVLGMLHAFGARRIAVAECGSSALQRSRQEVTDLLICDATLPELDGFDLVRRIRTESDNPNRYTPVIVLTSHTQAGNIVRARDCGANIVLAKPISPKALYQRLVWITEDPRPFVIAPGYIGPDRRFRDDLAPAAGDRRHGKLPARSAASGPVLQLSMH